MGNPSMNKRQKEKNRQDRAREKDAARKQRRIDKAQKGPREGGVEDPDIAGIVPGPQPPAEE